MMKRVNAATTLLGLLCVPAISADIYSARKAYQERDLPAAFEQFTELAQLGSVEAQENLAVMYVNGEGIKRSNVLAYAWASLAKEQGGGEAVSGIVAQLDPHMNDAARGRVAEVRDQFGPQALQARLLPVKKPRDAPKNPGNCTIVRPGNPDDYYPAEAKRAGLAGRVVVEAPIATDGRARNPRILYAAPPGVFEEAARWVALSTAYDPGMQDGRPAPCTMRFAVKFTGLGYDAPDLKEKFEGTRQKAIGGDPKSQFLYGLLMYSQPEFGTNDDDNMPWFVKAAQAGEAGAQFMVGSYLFTGWGVEQDVAKAAQWFGHAAGRGHVGAQLALANYLLRPDKTNLEHAKAIALLDKAVAAGSRDGHLYLAAALAAGPDADLRNPARALDLIAVIKDIDHEPAAFEIRAAANAMLGQFAEAQADQKKAITVARKRRWDPAPLQARLDRYLAKQTWTGELMLY